MMVYTNVPFSSVDAKNCHLVKCFLRSLRIDLISQKRVAITNAVMITEPKEMDVHPVRNLKVLEMKGYTP